MTVKKVLLKSLDSKINLDDFDDEGLFYILSTEDSLIDKRVNYIHDKGFLKNIKFMTFDALFFQTAPPTNPNPLYSFYVLKKILRKYFPKEEYFHDFSKNIYDFFNDIFVEGIDFSSLLTFKDTFIKSLYEVIKEYESFFAKKNMTLYKAYRKSICQLKIKTLIVDGFVDFRYWHLKLIEDLSENSDVYIHLPFNLKEFNLIEKNLEIFKKMGFEIECDDAKELDSYLKGKNIEIIKGQNFYNNMVFSYIKKSINESSIKNLSIILNDKSMGELLYACQDLEELSFDLDRKIFDFIGDQIKIYFNFLDKKNRDNIILRTQLHYIPISQDVDKILQILYMNNFSRIEDFDEKFKDNLFIDKNHIGDFLDFVDKIKTEKIDPYNDLDYYINFLKNLEDEIREILDRDFENLKDAEIYRVGNLSLDQIDKFINIADSFKDMYDKISFKEFREILFTYLDSISLKSLRNYEGIKTASLDKIYYSNNEIGIYLSYDKNKNLYKKNFIYNDDNMEDLKRIGLVKDYNQIELIELIYSLCNDKKSIFLIKNDEISNSLNLIKTRGNIKISTYEDNYISSALNAYENINREDDFKLDSTNISQLKRILENRSFSATDFDSYVKSGRDFLIERVFKIEEYEDSFKEVDYLKDGSIYHKILENYFKNRKVYDEDYLKNLIMKETFPKCSKVEDLSFSDKFKFIKDFSYLLDIVRADTDTNRINKDFMPKLFEQRFSFDIGPINLVGSIDRIDAKDDEEILIDYKSSSSSTRTAADVFNNKSFQSVIYALARKNKDKKIAGFYYKIIKNFKNVPIFVNEKYIDKYDKGRFYKSDDEINELLDNSTNKIIELYKDMCGGVFYNEDEKKKGN